MIGSQSLPAMADRFLEGTVRNQNWPNLQQNFQVDTPGILRLSRRRNIPVDMARMLQPLRPNIILVDSHSIRLHYQHRSDMYLLSRKSFDSAVNSIVEPK